MIQVEDLAMSYAAETLFSNISFSINPKEKCGLIGRNGSGKTTLLRLIAGRENPDTGVVRLPKGYRIGYLDQHISFSQPTVLQEAVLGLSNEERSATYKAEKMLFGLGFDDALLCRAPYQVSGGFQLRLQMAKVLLSEPNCLLLDEPTNYLDILALRFLVRFLERWPNEMVVVSHDREFLDSFATHTLGLHRGRVRKVFGATTLYFSQLLLEEKMYERTRRNQEKKREHLQSYIDRFGAKATKASQAQSRKKALEKIPALDELRHLAQLDFSFYEQPFHGKKLMEVRQLCFSYEGRQGDVIHDFSLTIETGKKIAIVGRNGYGKSTLLRLLARELSPQRGSVRVTERVRIGYFGQTGIQNLHGEKTVEQEIASANTDLSSSEVKGLCGQMMFSGSAAEKAIAVLSGGEKSRVLLGKILATPCNMLLLDEPTHHLDVESVEALIDAVEAFRGVVVIVTHSELMLRRLSLDFLIVCHDGSQEVFCGGYEEFLEKVGWQEEQLQRAPASSKQDEKRKRAEFVAARSRILKPFREEIERLEAAIIALEEEEQRYQLLLTEGKEIADLCRKIGLLKKEVEELFERLMQVSAQHDEEKKKFESSWDQF